MKRRKPIVWDEQADAAANARRVLPGLAAEYFAMVRETLAGNPPPAELHLLRLATKRLRYTLELFRPCYGPSLETKLDSLRLIQQLLGEVSDSIAAAALLPESARARRFMERRAARKAREFRKHWTEVFDAPGQQALWIAHLGRARASGAGGQGRAAPA